MKAAVVGSNRGIGLALVEKLMKEGFEVYAFCRKSSSALNDLNPKAIIEGFEVTDSGGMKKKLAEIKIPNIDRLYHVSGIMKGTSLDNLDEAAMVEQFKVNSVAPLVTVQAFLPYLADNAKIGLLTSRMGSIDDNGSGGSYGYRMSKTALNSGGKSLALDLKDKGYAVFLLHPGWVQTDMTNNTGQVTTRESAQGLYKIMESKTISDTGTFWHMNGEQLPW